MGFSEKSAVYECVDREHDAWRCRACGYIENFEVAHHARKAIQTVAVHAGKAVLGENHSGVFGVRRGEAVLFQHAGELSDHFFVGDTFHENLLLSSV